MNLAFEQLKQLEDVARKGCENGPYFVDGSAAAERFLLHTEACDSVLLVCEQKDSEISISVLPPDGKRTIYSRVYLADEEGFRHIAQANILMTSKEVMNSAFASFEGRLEVS